MENLDEILSVDHIDVFFVAPGDLAQTMGMVGKHRDPKVEAVVEGAIRQIVASGGRRVRWDTRTSYSTITTWECGSS